MACFEQDRILIGVAMPGHPGPVFTMRFNSTHKRGDWSPWFCAVVNTTTQRHDTTLGITVVPRAIRRLLDCFRIPFYNTAVKKVNAEKRLFWIGSSFDGRLDLQIQSCEQLLTFVVKITACSPVFFFFGFISLRHEHVRLL